MGAGKTIITLMALNYLIHDDFSVSKVLVIGPKRVIETTWPDEIQKWEQTASLKASVISGNAKERLRAISQPADIYLIGKENVCWLVNTAGRQWDWDMVVIDELSTFKNPQSKRFRALKTLMPRISRLVGLTGTPAPKGIPDLWAQIYLMDKGQRLGKTLSAFRESYLKPGRRNGYVVYQWDIQPGAQERIQEKISDICMAIDQIEYASLPDCQIIDRMVDLKGDFTKYKKFKTELVLSIEDSDIMAINAGVLCSKLLQFTSGALYAENHVVKEIHNHKLEALAELVGEAQSPVLIFYWFQFERARIAKELKGFNGMDIKDPGSIEKWNHGELDYLLLQPSSAGHGLNLQQGGHIAVWYSLPNWNLELYQQANARIYRQGQKEKVLIYHLLAKDTVDQEMLKALKRKEITQNDLLDALKI